jgi:transcription elongation factor GreA
VGAEEANPMDGKISNESPLGSSLIGKKKGDTIEVLTPNGKIIYTIIDVE